MAFGASWAKIKSDKDALGNAMIFRTYALVGNDGTDDAKGSFATRYMVHFEAKYGAAAKSFFISNHLLESLWAVFNAIF